MPPKKNPAASRESKTSENTVKRKPVKSSKKRNMLKNIEDFLHFDEQSLREKGVLVQKKEQKTQKIPFKRWKVYYRGKWQSHNFF